MRAFASYLIGLFTLVALIGTGGAWHTSSRSHLQPVALGESDAAVFAPSLPVPVAEAPDLLGGCDPPNAGSVCLPGQLRSPPPPAPPSPYDLVPVHVESSEDWRPLVSWFFAPDDVDRAIRIIRCESRGRAAAKNPRSTASGLFQHLASAWPKRSAKAGWAGSDVFDPVANVAVAAWLVYDGGGWSHWNASSSCW